MNEIYQTDLSLLFDDGNFADLWQGLAGRNAAEICQKSLVERSEGAGYLIELAGARYLLDVPSKTVTAPPNRPRPDKRLALSLLYYLNGAKETGLSGRLVPETVLPGGDRFFAGGHALKRQPVLDVFGANGSALLEKAAALGGNAVTTQAGSFSFTLFLLPKIFVQVTLCEADEEFPASLYFAFDSSASDHVSLGVISSLVGLMNDFLIQP